MDDETVERVAKHRLQHAMEMVRRDAAVTLTDADVFEMWGLCPSSERELARDALLTIASELGEYIDREGSVDVTVALAFETARAALEHQP